MYAHPLLPLLYVFQFAKPVLKVCKICPWGFIKNYQHAMQRVEITIMRCPCDVIAFSIPRVFNPPLSHPCIYCPSLSILGNSNHSRIYTDDFCIMYSFIDLTCTHIYGRGVLVSNSSPSHPPPKASAISFPATSKMKAKIALFQLISGSTERAVHAGSCFFLIRR